MKLINKIKEKKTELKNQREEKEKKNVLNVIDLSIQECREKRNEYAVGSKEYSVLTDEITKLTELRINAEEMKTKNVMKRFEVIIQGIGVGAGLILKVAFFKAGMAFEQTGVFTSSIFKNLWSWIKDGKEK